MNCAPRPRGSTRQLQAFVALVEQCSITRAAGLCHLSQPAFSALIGQRHKGLQLACGDVGAGGVIHLQFICISNGLI